KKDGEVTTTKRIEITMLPPITAKMVTTPLQGDLFIRCQKEIQGVGMGVLSDGTPFLTQRGLARLCGVDNRTIISIGAEWQEGVQRPRISKIKELLHDRGLSLEHPFIRVTDRGTAIFAYPDTVCMAVLEYFAFEAGDNIRDEARRNFRILAAKTLHDFIYDQVGYDPRVAVSDEWRQFHDRLSLNYNAVPTGYFSIFKEIADMILTLGQHGLHIDQSFVPDISVGKTWSKNWTDNRLGERYGERIQWKHNYPEYFSQAASNPQDVWCYPEASLGEFRRWMRDDYIHGGKMAKYLEGQVKKRTLPEEFVHLAIKAYNSDEDVEE
nr:hypothetical protein [bacterium]